MEGNLLEMLRQQGALYHKTQIALAYHSRRLDGSALTEAQTQMIYDTKQFEGRGFVYDMFECCNHFKTFDYLLEIADLPLTQVTIKRFHELLKTGTHATNIGDYKSKENRFAGRSTTPPFHVESAMEELLGTYHSHPTQTLDTLADFHWQFDKILPFQDGNGPVIRLIMFKECLKYNIMPFIIFENYEHYYGGFPEDESEKIFLRDTYLTAQDVYKSWFRRLQ